MNINELFIWISIVELLNLFVIIIIYKYLKEKEQLLLLKIIEFSNEITDLEVRITKLNNYLGKKNE